MADAVYKIKFTMSDGSVKEIQFTAPQGPQGPKGATTPLYFRWIYGTNAQAKLFINGIMNLFNFTNVTFKFRYISPTNTPLTVGTPSDRRSVDSGDEVLMIVNSENNIVIQTIKDGVVDGNAVTANKTNLVFGFSGIASIELECNLDFSALFNG